MRLEPCAMVSTDGRTVLVGLGAGLAIRDVIRVARLDLPIDIHAWSSILEEQLSATPDRHAIQAAGLAAVDRYGGRLLMEVG